MLDKSILDKVVAFFKTIGTKKASGEPIDLGRRPRRLDDSKEVIITDDLSAQEKPASEATKTVKRVRKEKDVPSKEAPVVKSSTSAPKTATKVVVAKVRPRKVFSPEVEALRLQYPWRKLRVETPLPVQTLPEPLFFLSSDNQPVEANKLEISFVKELLDKAAQAGVENKFTFSMSATMNVVVKYKKKLIGRVYLHGKKHKMVFKVDGKTLVEDGLTLSDCKKLLIVWIGQIKENAA